MLHDSAKVRKLFFAIIIVVFLGLVFFLSLVFSGRVSLPQTFALGPLTIHYYGLIMAIAAAAGCYMAIKRAPFFGIDEQTAEDLLFWLIIGGFIGARIYHVLSSFGYYYAHPLDAFKVWNGGLSIYGAVVGGITTLIIYKSVSRVTLDTGRLLDWLAPSVVLGQIIGRFGNFFNYEAFGYPTNLPWKMFVPENFRPLPYLAQSFFHPWFLYEALGNLVILVFLLKLGKPKAAGKVVFSYLLLYNVLRFGLEFLRIDSTFIDGLRLNAIVSLILAGVGGLALIFIGKNGKIEQN